MGSEQYKIDWSADITPALAMLGNSMRSRAYLEMERDAVEKRNARESAALKRQEEQDKYNRAVQGWTALPGLKRMARKDVGAANTNPYGYKFEEGTDLAPGMEGPEPSPAAEAARYMMNPKAATEATPRTTPDVPTEQAPPDVLPRGVEGPIETPEGQAYQDLNRRSPDDTEALMAGAQEGVQPLDFMTQAAMAASGQSPEQKRLFMTYNGQRSEVPTQDEVSGFGEKYDAMYNALIDDGEDPHKARMFIAAQAKQEMADRERDNRLAQTLGFRGIDREDKQMFSREENEKYKRTFEQAMKLAETAGRYKVAASAPGLKADAANSRDMGVLRQQGNAIRATTQYAKLDAKDKTVRSLFLNIASGSVPLQHGDAQIQLARYFRGTTPTEGEMALLYHNLGGTKDKWNQFVARMETGDLSPEQLRQLKVTARGVRKEHEEDKKRFVSTARHMLGPGSGFDNMPDQAQALFDGLASELGIGGLPPLYDTEGGVTLGSGKRPNPTPRKPSKGHLDALESEVSGM